MVDYDQYRRITARAGLFSTAVADTIASASAG